MGSPSNNVPKRLVRIMAPPGERRLTAMDTAAVSDALAPLSRSMAPKRPNDRAEHLGRAVYGRKLG